MNTLYVALFLSWMVATIGTPLVRRLSLANGWLDNPGERKVHKIAIPRVGGLAVAVAFFTPLVGLAIYQNPLSFYLYANTSLFVGFLIGALAIVILGFWDDLNGMSARTKFLVQCSVALFVWWAGFRVDIVNVPFVGFVETGMLSAPLTMLWLVGIVNAMNLIDGLDGLAAGIALLAGGVLLGVALMSDIYLLALLMVCLIGSILGFLFFNFNPAKIFLGDSGSMFLGFVLGVASIWTQQKSAAAAAVAIPLLALAIPILDTALCFFRRIANRQNPFRADKGHLHHRLLAMGLSHRSAVLTLYVASGVLCLAGLALLDHSHVRQAVAMGTALLAILVFVRQVGLFKVPVVSPKRSISDETRDGIRVLAREIRRATSTDSVWEALIRRLDLFHAQGARLSWVVEDDEREGRQKEEVYRYGSAAEGGEKNEKPVAREIRVVLHEGHDQFGELRLETGDIEPVFDQGLEMIRDALIDHFVERKKSVASAFAAPSELSRKFLPN